MRILPREQRDAMFEIYSFCRRVDDIADSHGPRDERLAELDAWRAEVNAL
jgi:phytoene synthase